MSDKYPNRQTGGNSGVSRSGSSIVTVHETPWPGVIEYRQVDRYKHQRANRYVEGWDWRP